LLRPDLPKPAALATTALGARLGDTLRQTVAGVDEKPDGVGLILASPEFQRT